MLVIFFVEAVTTLKVLLTLKYYWLFPILRPTLINVIPPYSLITMIEGFCVKLPLRWRVTLKISFCVNTLKLQLFIKCFAVCCQKVKLVGRKISQAKDCIKRKDHRTYIIASNFVSDQLNKKSVKKTVKFV